jgi:RNA ligase (TIGR02306 family)
MSERIVEMVTLGEVCEHPNADRLEITDVHGGYPCILMKRSFKEGDTALYVPVDMMVPATEQWEFLARGRTPRSIDGKSYHRIRALKLRGIFSMGVIIPIPEELSRRTIKPGVDFAEALGIIKYEPPEPMQLGGENEKDPGFLPHYDLDGLRRYGEVLEEGEDVVITEKIHGCNGRWAFHESRLWSASRTCFKRNVGGDPGKTQTVWWKVAEQYELEAKLSQVPGFAIYGEVYGQVQDLRYGVHTKGHVRLVVFDVLEISTRRWLDYKKMVDFCEMVDLPMAPSLHIGPWKPELARLAEGRTTFDGVDHVREGLVVKPLKERFDERVGRVILKLHGEGYLTRKSKNA